MGRATNQVMLRTPVVIAGLAWGSVTAAEPVVAIEGPAPFSADELSDAVRLRGAKAREIHVVRRGEALVVEVGGAEQVVTLTTDDSREAARTIAMIVIALEGEPPGGPVQVRDREDPAPPPAEPPPRRLGASARLTLGRGRDDGGTYTAPLTGALSVPVAGSARVTASVSLMQATSPRRGDLFVPVRLGVEGRAGTAGLELGGFIAAQRDCLGSPTSGYGGYVAGRVYMPLSRRYQFVIEASGYYAIRQAGGCMPYDLGAASGPATTLYGEAYGAAIAAGVEWAL
jgi:hypothetical protein